MRTARRGHAPWVPLDVVRPQRRAQVGHSNRCTNAGFVSSGDFGLASGKKSEGGYERVWFDELMSTDEVAFEADVFLLRKDTAAALKSGAPPEPQPGVTPSAGLDLITVIDPIPTPEPEPGVATKTLRLVGTVPPEMWNRLGTKILPKLRSGSDLKVGVDFSITVNAAAAESLASELRQMLQELGLADAVRFE